eukprot:4747076-Pleurochrysis_carterae.AAC.3
MVSPMSSYVPVSLETRACMPACVHLCMNGLHSRVCMRADAPVCARVVYGECTGAVRGCLSTDIE